MPDRPQKITFADMRVRGLLIYCSDYKCSHLIMMSGDLWPDDMRLSDLEQRFASQPAASVAPTSGRTSDWNGGGIPSCP